MLEETGWCTSNAYTYVQGTTDYSTMGHLQNMAGMRRHLSPPPFTTQRRTGVAAPEPEQLSRDTNLHRGPHHTASPWPRERREGNTGDRWDRDRALAVLGARDSCTLPGRSPSPPPSALEYTAPPVRPRPPALGPSAPAPVPRTGDGPTLDAALAEVRRDRRPPSGPPSPPPSRELEDATRRNSRPAPSSSSGTSSPLARDTGDANRTPPDPDTTAT